MELYSVQSLFGPSTSGACSSPAGEGEPNAEPEPFRICSCTQLADRCATLLALTTSEGKLVLVYGRSEWAASSSPFLVKQLGWGPEPEKRVRCQAFSPSGRWLANVLDNGHVVIVPTALILGEVKTSKLDAGVSPLFPEDEFTEIGVEFRDDCLKTPTCAFWYETRFSRRPLLIYSNKGGDVLLVDLLVRKLSVALQAPQSIHDVEVIEDAPSGDVYLLVTGFAGSQWLIPLEIDSQSVRETLGKVVPTDLKQLCGETRGELTRVISRGTPCLGIFKADSCALEIYNTVNLQNPAMEVKLPADTTAVHFTDRAVFCLLTNMELYIQLQLALPVDEFQLAIFEPLDADEVPLEFAQLLNGALEKATFFDFVAVRYHLEAGELPMCLVVTEMGVYVLKPIITAEQLFFQSLRESDGFSACRSLCAAFEMDFDVYAAKVLPLIFASASAELSSAGSSNSLYLALGLCERAEMALNAIVDVFYEHGHSAFILPFLTRWLGSRRTLSQEHKNVLSKLALKLQFELFEQAEGYEKHVISHNLRQFVLKNQWYDPEDCLVGAVRLRLWDCCSAMLRLHDVAELFVRQMLMFSSSEWDQLISDQQFVNSLAFPNLSALFGRAPGLATPYLRRLAVLFDKLKVREQMLPLLDLTNPKNVDVAVMLTAGRRDRLENDEWTTAVAAVADAFLLTLTRYLYGFNDAASEQRDNAAAVELTVPKDEPAGELEIIRRSMVEKRPLDTGPFHGVALANGALYTWGRNRSQAVSLTTAAVISSRYGSRTVPTVVDLPLSCASVRSVACGADQTLVLAKNGLPFAWGANQFGQLGLGHRNAVRQPQPLRLLADQGNWMRYPQRNLTLMALPSSDLGATDVCVVYSVLELEVDVDISSWGCADFDE